MIQFQVHQRPSGNSQQQHSQVIEIPDGRILEQCDPIYKQTYAYMSPRELLETTLPYPPKYLPGGASSGRGTIV